MIGSMGALSGRGHGLGGPALGIRLRAAGRPHLSLIRGLWLHSQSRRPVSRGVSFSPRGPGVNSSVKCLSFSWKNQNQEALLPGDQPVSSLKVSQKEHSKSLVLGGLEPGPACLLPRAQAAWGPASKSVVHWHHWVAHLPVKQPPRGARAKGTVPKIHN